MARGEGRVGKMPKTESENKEDRVRKRKGVSQKTDEMSQKTAPSTQRLTSTTKRNVC